MGFSFSPANLIGNIIFSAIGFVAFTYGKRTANFQLMGMGGALMVYGYFVPNTALLYLIGAGLTAALYYMRE